VSFVISVMYYMASHLHLISQWQGPRSDSKIYDPTLTVTSELLSFKFYRFPTRASAADASAVNSVFVVCMKACFHC
jgi:hypothetical protein